MKSRLLLTVAMVGVAVGAGSLFASNMGFKLVRPLISLTPNESLSGSHILALPYVPRAGLLKAWDLRSRIGAADVISISGFSARTDALFTYSGTPATNFDLLPGQGYLIQMSANVDFTIVGSHDPGLTFTLRAIGSLGSLSGTNNFAPPYHATATTAGQLRAELNAAAGVAANSDQVVLSISRFLTQSDSLETYAGTVANDFTLEPSQAYLIQVARDLTFVPSHY